MSWIARNVAALRAFVSPGRIRRARSRRKLLAMLPRHGVGAEVGVHMGDFSARLLAATRPKKLHLIDPWKHEGDALYSAALYGGTAVGGQAEMDSRYQHVVARFQDAIGRGLVEVHRSTARGVFTSATTPSLDWVYIDGNHLYEFVRDDLELFAGLVRPGGLIAGDDYIDGGWWKGGVKRAVDEFLQHRAHDFQLVALDGEQFVLGRKPD